MDGRMLGGGQVEMEGVGGSLPPRFVCVCLRVCMCVYVPSQRDAAAQKVRESLPESL